MIVLAFGLRLVYKLRNASDDGYSEKPVLSAAIFIELLVSLPTYVLKHTLWHRLTSVQLLCLYTIRCQLTVTPTLALIFCPKVSKTPIQQLLASLSC